VRLKRERERTTAGDGIREVMKMREKITKGNRRT
jgi:hypothetical protein